MSVILIKSPFEDKFVDVLRQTKQEIVFSSPYINNAGVSILLSSYIFARKVLSKICPRDA